MTNVPEIRFKGFINAWVKRKLSEVGEFKNGMNFDKDAMGHGYPFVNLQDIFGKTMLDDSELGLAESTEKQRQEYSLKKGDVLFIRSSVKPEGVGETALVATDMPDTTYSGFIIRFRVNIKLYDQFKRFVFTTKSIRNQIMTKATSSANTNINQDSLGLLGFSFPCVNEQEKIGDFFHTLDNAVTLHQRKLEYLRKLKRGYLQQMFPKPGELTPRLRFAGFSEPWQERRLGEVLRKSKKTTPANPNEIELLTVKLHLQGIKATGSKPNVTKKGRPYYIRNSGELVVGRQNYHNGGIGIAGREVDGLIASNAISSFDFLENVDDIFLLNAITHPKYLEYVGKIIMQGTGQQEISEDTFLSLATWFPCKAEQNAIGNFFRALDGQITTQAQKVDSLKKLKAAYLQRMFV